MRRGVPWNLCHPPQHHHRWPLHVMRRVPVRPKSHDRDEYPVFCSLLRELRDDAGLRQTDLAELLRVQQNYVSAYEMGKVRLDFVQIRDWCAACSSTFAHLLARFEEVWALPESARLERARQRAAAQEAAWAAHKAALAALNRGSVPPAREGLPDDGGDAPAPQSEASGGVPAGPKPRASSAGGSSSASARQVPGPATGRAATRSKPRAATAGGLSSSAQQAPVSTSGGASVRKSALPAAPAARPARVKKSAATKPVLTEEERRAAAKRRRKFVQ